TTRELGGALGVAVLGSLVASRYDTRLSPALDLLPASLRGKAEESLAGALHAAGDLGGPTSARVASIAREAFVSGMHLAAVIAGCVALLAAGIVYRKLPSGNPHATGAASVGLEPVVTEH
ncbi:MAG: MFS transporter, partial [Actinomycetota bacterium]|nr:MFS transporter [Actinomycetota bacterium]